jgi:predicted ATP-grasp superfamily ATP-dependent carboligase
MNRVLLISFVNWDSLIEIPAIFKNGGCTVDIFCTKDSWVLQNKAYDKWIAAPNDESAFTTQLLDFVEKNGDNYFWIVPGDDIVLRLLNDRITSESLFYRIMPLTKIENRDLMGSKAGFSALCTKYSIKTPRYLIYQEGMTAKSIAEYMNYPFLMKLDKSEGGFGVFMCENETEFTANFENVKNRHNLVFQQFIKGYDVNVEVLFKNGELIVYSYSRTIKIMGKFGVSTQRLFYQNNEVENELVKAGRSMGLNGFGNVVFMFSETERSHYLIEIDMRPNAWMYYGKFRGNDFSEAVKKIVKGDLTLVRPPAQYEKKQIKISLYKKDVYRCLLEKDFKGLLGWLVNKDNCWKYIPLYDSKTFWACTRYLNHAFWYLLRQKIKGKG